jgi:DNA-directed RNA polymerase specialized sigma24 family protein
MDDADGSASPDRTLQAAQFEGLLRCLDPDRDRAGELYEKLRRKLIKFFEWNSCSPGEDLADETLDRVARKVAEEIILDLPAFAAAVAKRVRQEAYKKAVRRVQVPDLPNQEAVFQDPRNPEKILQEKRERERRSRCLHICMRRLGDRDRELFLRYHDEAGQRLQHRLELASKFGLTIGTLRVRINRVRDSLESCTRNCMASRQGRIVGRWSRD